MSKTVKSILGFMHLDDNEYADDDLELLEDEDEEYEDDYEEPAPKKSKKSRFNNKPKKSKVSKISDYDDYEEEDDDDEYEEEEVKTTSRFSSGRKKSNIPGRNNNLVSFQGQSNNKMHVARPTDFDSSQYISDLIISGITVIINYEQLPPSEAQRVIDFIAGAVYAINGTLRSIHDGILVATPPNVGIEGEFQELADSMDVPSFYSIEEE